jgi:V8-like Glu-specific endopeptidase
LPGNVSTYGQTSTVGALFSTSASGQLLNHFCTASVVDSPAGNLIVTAAHCMQGQKLEQVVFVPDYSAGQAPYGMWNVTRVVEDQPWLASGDPDDDFAFLVVAQPGSNVPVETLTGGEVVGFGQPIDRDVVVAGYPDLTDTPLTCRNTLIQYSPTQYQFDCDGFTDGTSGSPLLANGAVARTGAKAATDGTDMVIGVIGGYEQGGYTPSVSYAARFNGELAQLYQTAVALASRLVPAQAVFGGFGATVTW